MGDAIPESFIYSDASTTCPLVESGWLDRSLKSQLQRLLFDYLIPILGMMNAGVQFS